MDQISVLIITYKRTDCAIRTIRGLRDNFAYDPNALHFHLADDGSSAKHIKTLIDEIAGFCRNPVSVTNSNRRGVGVSMNMGQQICFARSDHVLWLEDDWELVKAFDPSPCLQLLNEDHTIGMIRLGYISPGITGELISGAGRLWWRLDKGPTYTFAGHASLRHKRFYDAYGKYPHNLAPGATELYMCGVFNNTAGPSIVLPAWTGEWGAFAHIGTDSFKDEVPV